VANAILAGDQDRDTSAHNPYRKVSLLFEHGPDMIIGVIGALKAGKTYVPLDIAYPLKRLLYMLDNSESYLILTNQANILTAKQLTARARVKIDILNIDTIVDPEASIAEFAAPLKVNPDTPAYILYTSGSTGRPKGVMQTQRNILYYTRNWIQRFSITHSDRMTLFSAFSHDGSVQDMFAALLAGATLQPYNIKNADSTNPIYTL
jgi:non-ribosomal peptide synthetase component F